MSRSTKRPRSGMTLVELMIASAIGLFVIFLLMSLWLLANSTWNREDAGFQAKELLAMVAARIEPTIRAALRVDSSHSNAGRLTVILPKIDPSTGAYALPLADGDTIAFYLSDTSGSTTASGNLLWRSVNGTPDTAWSLRGSKGAMDLGTTGLQLTYLGAPTIKSVQVSVTTQKSSGRYAVAQTAATQILLRNRRYQ